MAAHGLILEPDNFCEEMKTSKLFKSLQNRLVYSVEVQFFDSRPFPGLQGRNQPPPFSIYPENGLILEPEIFCGEMKISKPSKSLQNSVVYSVEG